MMKEILKKGAWSPYAVGALIGVLSWLMFFVLGQHIGTTLSFVKVTGAFEALFAPSHFNGSEYFARYFPGNPLIGWQVVFVISIFFGSLLASRLSGERRIEHVPSIWVQSFGPSRLKRNIGAFIGGFLVLFGARIAGGCTSGHAISGGLQLALSGWVFIAAVFAGGIATSFAMYSKRRA